MKDLAGPAATLALFAGVCLGCGASGDETAAGVERVTAPIIGGTSASDYPEAALVEMAQQGRITAACSGALVAPAVVLTAGHCVDGFTGWHVSLPFLNQSATASAAETFDWKSDGSDFVASNQHDVGLVYLDRALTAAAYPALAEAPLPDGSAIVDIGRIDDGTFSNSALFVSAPLAVQAGARVGYPFDYVGNAVIEHGDSGGPVEVPGATPHQIVAVNSGSGDGVEVLARVDLLSGWIRDRIAAHGGAGSVAAAEPAESPSCDGPAEAEPNDDYRAASPLGSSACGNLGAADAQDWYTWSIAGATPYDVTISTAGDATLAMWKLVAGGYVRVQNTSATEIAHTASGAGAYVLAVYTPSGTAQPYRLTLTK